MQQGRDAKTETEAESSETLALIQTQRRCGIKLSRGLEASGDDSETKSHVFAHTLRLSQTQTNDTGANSARIQSNHSPHSHTHTSLLSIHIQPKAAETQTWVCFHASPSVRGRYFILKTNIYRGRWRGQLRPVFRRPRRSPKLQRLQISF